jgi:hypothetical protein
MKYSLNFIIFTIMVLSLLAGEAESNTDEVSSRFSIAISGGASKGAYEAGLNWGALKIMLEYPKLVNQPSEHFIPLEASSIAGASAGGINTLLSGLTWCSLPEKEGGINNRSDDNIFRDIWLRIDINTLLPANADSPIYLPDDAVLSRKDLLEAAGDLRDNWNKPLFRKDCRIPLGVTVTRIKPDISVAGGVQVQNQRFYIPFEMRVKDDNSIDFFFDPADYPKLADSSMILLPRSADAPAFSISDESIEDATFTSSAFPMAFGRKRLQYCRLIVQDTGYETRQDTQTSTNADTGLVCPDSYELTEAEFADGGLFDNLPIGVASKLAELNKRAEGEPYPVTYLYIDPNRTRYEIPEYDKGLACDSPKPPEACRTMEYSAASESKLLVGFFGTARRYELHRELTSDYWQLNLSEISYRLAEILRHNKITLDCGEDLPYFEHDLDCAEALLHSGRLLEFAYDRKNPEIGEPYSVNKLRKTGAVRKCTPINSNSESRTAESRTICDIDVRGYREQLNDAMLSIAEKAELTKRKIYSDIKKSRLSMQNDRILRVSSRGAPITGTLLQDFGSFLDYKFREYDYYVGLYDSLILIVNKFCDLQYSSSYQSEKYRQCFDSVGEQMHTALGLNTDPRGRYVFAKLAMGEYSNEKLLEFAYKPMPTTDSDMQIINEGLQKALIAGESEEEFFKFLKAEGFVPTADKIDSKSRLSIFSESDGKPLLEEIIDNPDSWAAELTRRVTARLVYLETEAEKVYTAREPDEQKRESANTTSMGGTAFVMQSITYKYPDFSFAPSTAPEKWFWRNVIPYEIGFDLGEGDILLTWQPTLAISEKDLIGARLSLGFPGGLFQSSADVTRENYFATGLDYTRLTSSPYLSSYGFTPTWFHALNQPEIVDRDTVGGDIHMSILKNRMRFAIGTRDFENASDNWYLTVGITDLPGMIYWLTR